MLFSVIIPTYNRETVIKRAIDSVLCQSEKDFELIIVDDGSTDKTEDVVNSYDDNRIVYIQQANGGASSARNNGIMNARGKYISFLDSDDIWYPQILEMQKNKYESDTEISCVYSDLESIAEDGSHMLFWNSTGIEGYIYAEALKQGSLSPTIVLSAKKECFDKVGGFDLNFPASQDDDMCFRLAKYFKFGYIDIPLAGVYVNSNDRISSSSKKVSMGWWMLWNKYEEDVLKYCGNEVMANKYTQCARRFSICGNQVLMNKALDKIYHNGGSVSFLQKIFLNLCCKGIVKGLSDKVLNKIM